MLIQNINANVLKKNEKETSHRQRLGYYGTGCNSTCCNYSYLPLFLVDCICCVHEPVWQMKFEHTDNHHKYSGAAKR